MPKVGYAAKQPLRAEENSPAAINKTGEVLLFKCTWCLFTFSSRVLLMAFSGPPLTLQGAKFNSSKAKRDKKMKRKQHTWKQRFLYLSIQSGNPLLHPPMVCPTMISSLSHKRAWRLAPQRWKSLPACVRVCAHARVCVCVCVMLNNRQCCVCLSYSSRSHSLTKTAAEHDTHNSHVLYLEHCKWARKLIFSAKMCADAVITLTGSGLSNGCNE